MTLSWNEIKDRAFPSLPRDCIAWESNYLIESLPHDAIVRQRTTCPYTML
ncbi:MAG: hypothetical protein QM800_04565 [Paludibacter sp.]